MALLKSDIDERLPKAPSRTVWLGDASPQLGDRGFIVTSVDQIVQWARQGSLMWNTFGLACCAVEMMQAAMPRYVMERLGVAPRGSLVTPTF
jgi:NADH-quinone oxidoreductase subunit B